MSSREKRRNSNQRSSSSIIDTLPSDTSAEHSSDRVARPKSEGAGQPPRFLECLVTPKLTFSLRHEGRSSASDIDQDVIRAAFLTRFSLPIDCSKLTFSVVGSPKLDDDTTKLVMRIKHEDADEERVMLRILTSIEEAFETKYPPDPHLPRDPTTEPYATISSGTKNSLLLRAKICSLPR